MINSFRGYYYFLSNMYPCKIMSEGKIYDCAEAAFQAMKLESNADRNMFVGIDGFTAKRCGKMVLLRRDWNAIRVDIMKKIIEAKFNQNKDLAEMLVSTAPHELAEGNTWGDTFWGVCNGVGRNNLGKILMAERNKLMGK